MKIVFDDENDKVHFIASVCPDKVTSKLFNYCADRCDAASCDNCWEESGIELEVKDENSV